MSTQRSPTKVCIVQRHCQLKKYSTVDCQETKQNKTKTQHVTLSEHGFISLCMKHAHQSLSLSTHILLQKQMPFPHLLFASKETIKNRMSQYNSKSYKTCSHSPSFVYSTTLYGGNCHSVRHCESSVFRVEVIRWDKCKCTKRLELGTGENTDKHLAVEAK